MSTGKFNYKKVLITGATSGIGRALADTLIKNGIAVVAVGRRQEQLDAFVAAHASTGKAFSSAADISDQAKLPSWTASILKEHPDLDAVILNAGVQRAFDFSLPTSIDLKTVEMALHTNYLCQVVLALSFLPHLQKLSEAGHPSLLAFTTSMLALVPFYRCGNYSATKAALHAFILSMRAQLTEAMGDKAPALIEIMPPAVQTELHDSKHQPDLGNNAGRNIGMPLDEYTSEAWKGLQNGDMEVVVFDNYGAYGPNGHELGRREEARKLNSIMPSCRPKQV